jgi:hypothetical protein
MKMSTSAHLQGHTSEDTAYMVSDYPYGRRERCRIRYWIEKKAGKGFRFCSQTEHPRTLVWNAPKRSNYADIAGEMITDEKGHVVWIAVGIYSEPAHVLAFLDRAPGADVSILKDWTARKVAFYAGVVSGAYVMTINGAPVERREADIARDAETLEGWRAVAARLGLNVAARAA